MTADGTGEGLAPPGERELIADYVAHLGAAGAREVLRHIARSAEGLLDRIEVAAAGGAADRSLRRIAHDIAGTLGSLGLAAQAELARSVERAPADLGEEALGRLLRPLLDVRGAIAGRALAILDELLADPPPPGTDRSDGDTP